MARYITISCPKKENHPKDYTFDSGKIIGHDAKKMMDHVKCECCGHEFQKESPLVRGKSLKYPHYNDSLGENVTCRGHEEHIAKEQGFNHI